jgi:hypothetical protein
VNIDEQFLCFAKQAIWLDGEKNRILRIIGEKRGRISLRTWCQLLEISNRTRQLNREFCKFKEALS